MRYRVLLCILVIVLCSVTVVAGAKFKYKTPVNLIKNGLSVRPQSLGIAAGDDCYGVVYDTYWAGKTSSKAWFMVIDADGKVLAGPVKIGKKKHVMDPQIAYGNDTFIVVTSAGKQVGKWNWDLYYYVTIFDKKGKKLSSQQLDMVPYNELSGMKTKAMWTGTEFSVFYHGTDNRDKPFDDCYLAKVQTTGEVGASVKLDMYSFPFFDIVWDGEQFVYACLTLLNGEYDQAQVDIYLLDKNGTTLKHRQFSLNVLVQTYQGVKVVQTHNSGKYLLAYSAMRPDTVSPPEVHWYDMYTSVLSLEDGEISGFTDPRNITISNKYDWSFPTLLRDGKKYFLTAALTITGSSQGFARLAADGKMRRKPLTNIVEGPICGQWPPYAAMLNGECGYVFWYETVQFNAVIP